MSTANLTATVARWSRPSTLLLLAITVAFFGPGIWDRHIRERPWITAEIIVDTGARGATVVRSITNAKHPVSGRRLIWIEDAAADTLCTAQRTDIWTGRRERTWTFEAFLEHEPCGTPPAVPYRVCSEFDVETNLGSRGRFGPFCTRIITPRKGADHAD